MGALKAHGVNGVRSTQRVVTSYIELSENTESCYSIWKHVCLSKIPDSLGSKQDTNTQPPPYVPGRSVATIQRLILDLKVLFGQSIYSLAAYMSL